MNAIVRMSAEGAVVIPREIRERLHLDAGVEFEVIDEADRLVLQLRPAARTPADHPKLTHAEFLARLPKYEGPPVSLEDMDRAIDNEMRARWERKSAR